MSGMLRRARLQHLDDLPLAHLPVRDVLVETRLRVLDHVTVGRARCRASRLILRRRSSEARYWIMSPPRLRVHDGRRAVQHVVPGEQRRAPPRGRSTGGSARGRACASPRAGTPCRRSSSRRRARGRASGRTRRPSVPCRTRRSTAPVSSRIRARGRPVIGMRVREQHPTTRSRIDAPTIASMWLSSAGPGSITATSSMPTR